MINVRVGTNYLAYLIEAGKAAFGSQVPDEIENIQKDCATKSWITVAKKAELLNHSVYDLLELHFRHLKKCVPTDVLERIQKEIVEIGRRDYYLPTFQSTREDAENTLAMHKVFPHGVVTGRATRGYPE